MRGTGYDDNAPADSTEGAIITTRTAHYAGLATGGAGYDVDGLTERGAAARAGRRGDAGRAGDLCSPAQYRYRKRGAK